MTKDSFYKLLCENLLEYLAKCENKKEGEIDG